MSSYETIYASQFAIQLRSGTVTSSEVSDIFSSSLAASSIVDLFSLVPFDMQFSIYETVTIFFAAPSLHFADSDWRE